MRDLPAGRRRAWRRSTVAGSPRSRVSSTATPTPASAATGSTSSRSAPAAPPTRSSTPRAAASSRPCARPARRARTSSTAVTLRHRELDARARHDDVRGQVGLRPRPRHRARAAAGDPRRRRRSDVARRAHGAARVRRRRRLPRLPPRGGAARGGRSSPRPPTSSSSAARSTPGRRGATWRPAATRASPCGCTATSSPSRVRSRSRSSSARARSTISRRPGRPASPQLAASDVTGVLLPASALFLGRPMPPARALADAGALIALATDFNPGSAFCDSLPLVLSLACTQMKLAPEEALVAATANAAHVLGRADRIGRLAAGLRGRRRAARRTRLAPRRLPPRAATSSTR